MSALTLLMLAVTFVGITYVLTKHIMTRRINSLESQLALVVGPRILKPIRAHKPLPSWLCTTVWSATLILGGFIGLLAAPEAHAEFSENVRAMFGDEISRFVTAIMNDKTNNVFIWSKMLLGFLFFIVLVQEISYFIFEGIDFPRITEAAIYVFLTLIIWKSYDYATEAFWGVGVGISDGLQQSLVGNTDNFFLSQWMIRSVHHIDLPDVGIFDGINLVIRMAVWFVVCLILDCVAWIANMWATYGYALSKIVGILFVPFLMVKGTRPLFDGWVKFFIGFVVLKIILKATLVIAVMTIKTTMESLGVKYDGYGFPNGAPPSISLEKVYMLMDASAMLLVAILFILSSFVFAAALAGGSGNLSGGLGKAAQGVSKAITKVL